MIITTEMIRERYMVEYQCRILESLGGRLDTADFAKALVAAKRGLDLAWIIREFIPDPDTARQFREAMKAIADTIKATKTTIREAFEKSKLLTTPYVFAPEVVLSEAMEPIEETLKNAPTAAAFVAAFTGR